VGVINLYAGGGPDSFIRNLPSASGGGGETDGYAKVTRTKAFKKRESDTGSPRNKEQSWGNTTKRPLQMEQRGVLGTSCHHRGEEWRLRRRGGENAQQS